MWLVFNSDLLAPRVSGQRSQPWEQPPVLFLRTNSSRQFNFDLNPKTDPFRDRSIFELIFTLLKLSLTLLLHFDCISISFQANILTLFSPAYFPYASLLFGPPFTLNFWAYFHTCFELILTLLIPLHYDFISNLSWPIILQNIAMVIRLHSLMRCHHGYWWFSCDVNSPQDPDKNHFHDSRKN